MNFIHDQPIQSSCINCPPGYFCDAGIFGAISNYSQYICPEDDFIMSIFISSAMSALSTSGANADPCLTGSYCPDQTADPVPCPAGTFNPSLSLHSEDQFLNCIGESLSAVVGPCFASFYCPLGSDSQTKEQYTVGNYCPIGYYCPVETEVICPIGKYCPTGTAVPQDCPAGYYTGSDRKKECQICPEADNLTSPSGPCGAGHYCTSGALSANPTMLSASQCPAGTVHPIVGDVCPIGHYCPEGTDNPIGCPAGTYQDLTTQDHCKDCPSGYYCPANTTTLNVFDCPACHYCPVNTTHATEYPCPPQTFNNLTNGDRMPSGPLLSKRYWLPTGMQQWNLQPTRLSLSACFVMEASIVMAQDCLRYLGLVTQTFFTDFIQYSRFLLRSRSIEAHPLDLQMVSTARRVNPSRTPISTDVHLATIVQLTSTDVPLATIVQLTSTYVPLATIVQLTSTDVPLATIVQLTQWKTATTRMNTRKTHANFAQQVTSVTMPSSQSAISNYECPRVSSATEAPSFPTPLTLSDRQLLYEPTPCPSGTIAKGTSYSNLTDCEPCKSGNYCTAISSQNVESLPCTAGYICLMGSDIATPTDNIIGYICPAGHYRLSGDIQETPCSPGTYQIQQGQDSCDICPAGRSCPDLGMNYTLPCPAGYYCLSGTQNDGEPCPIGRKYCGGEALTEPTGPCAEWYYCPAADDIGDASPLTGYLCPAGSICPANTADPIPCDPGTYQENVGKFECDACPAGYYCLSNTSFGCPDAVLEWDLNDASTNLEKPVDCSACIAGKYCTGVQIEAHARLATSVLSGIGVSDPDNSYLPNGGLCTYGFYCEEGVTTPATCPPNSFVDKEGAISQAECQPCPGGRICPENSTVSEPCWRGYYCMVTMDSAIRPNGTYNDQTGMISFASLAISVMRKALLTTQPNHVPSDISASTPQSIPSHVRLEHTGAIEPVMCPASYGEKIGALHVTFDDTCEPCHGGYYSVADGSGCLPCRAGVVCLDKAMSDNPVANNSDLAYSFGPNGTVISLPTR
ncbi:hypothetical protein MAR_011901 [Mya arenaria]|uniref:Tyrosine-protein kinase ephrin type A/B receptor-like domain-containing protein n=1 Tax=Mya arenaria TaxID=6604 RepID=A0ABY7FVL4_MYAAR|nr:hypothetical protein MAR_011901 [Mya arenaria]